MTAAERISQYIDGLKLCQTREREALCVYDR